MKGILEYSWSELLVRGSRFLAEAFPVETQEEARELLKSQKAKYADATHVVHAFVLG
ncbi:MAG TPA: YigZ family protein, partial [Treponemataceae bacterium]|nr:YigZ family protein [Treponemataceae bacterium]